jgi:hypothetical protein
MIGAEPTFLGYLRALKNGPDLVTGRFILRGESWQNWSTLTEHHRERVTLSRLLKENSLPLFWFPANLAEYPGSEQS